MTQGIAHNLNNLLGVVVGYLDLLKLRMNQPDKLEKSIASMEKAVKRMVNLVRQLSSMVTDEPVARIKANPGDCVANVVARSTRKTDSGVQTVSVENNLPDDFETFTSLETIETCVEHLMRNGIESYPEGTQAEDRPINVTLNLIEDAGDKEIEIRICDRGEGIHPSVRDSLFDPFISTKNSVGRGFGLTVVKHSISHIGGGVTVIPNSNGKGTCAILRIPVEIE
jgi:signal transduction histidine kinase